MPFNPDNTVVLTLKYGQVAIELLPQLAPNHVARFKELVNDGFYDGLVFHRVISGFMAQTGCPKGDGTGGSGEVLKDEISLAHHVRGMVSMANAGQNTGDSQFFITFVNCNWLDGKHTIFGRVINGMELVDKINSGGTSTGAAPDGHPDKILSMQPLNTTGLNPEDIIDLGPTEESYLHEPTPTHYLSWLW